MRNAPSTVPLNVPFRTLWHDAHEPSFGSTGANSALPVTVVSVCESVQVTGCGLNESDPEPLHAPVTSIAGGSGGGLLGRSGAVDGAAGDPQDAAAARQTIHSARVALTSAV
jgi:hypothetical protein